VGEKRLQRLAEELAAELNEFLVIKAEIVDAQARLGTRDPDPFELRALGSILHDVYNGAEGICHRVAREIDQQLPTGSTWHRDLLEQITVAIPQVRPPVIQPETVARLERYRGFRHVVRHIYGSSLDWVQLKPLLGDAITTIDAFATDIEQFIAFLRLMAGNNLPDIESM